MVISVAKSLALEDDGRREICQRSVVWHFPLRFHRLCVFAKQRLIAFAANDGKILIAARLLIDHF